jgi:hypothetical protein
MPIWRREFHQQYQLVHWLPQIQAGARTAQKNTILRV